MTAVLLTVERPLVTSWANQAHVFSIAQRHPEYKNWIYSHFIQIELIEGLSGHTVLNYSHLTTPEEDCPWIDISRTSIQQIEANEDLISFYKKTLSQGTYIYQFLNQYYIPYYPYYQKKDDLHDPLLVGYDDDREVFFLADFHKNPDGALRYGVFEVSYQELEDAVKKLPDELNPLSCIELWHYTPDASYTFDIQTVLRSIGDYLTSTFTLERRPTWLSKPVSEFGMKIYEHLQKQLEELGQDETAGDFRLFHVMSDHKQLMYERLAYMNDLGLIEQELVQAYKELLQETSTLRNLLLKFGLNRRISLLNRIQSMLLSLAENERTILEGVLKSLQETQLVRAQGR